MAIVGGILEHEDHNQTSKNSALTERLRKDITKKFGEGIFKSGNDVLERKAQTLKIGPSLNAALNGGIPEGAISIISGKEKGGKTTTVLSFLSQCQQANKHIYYHDIEWRLKPMNLAGIKDLNTDPEHFTVIRSEQGKVLTAEEHLEILQSICHNHQGCVVVLDSASALCSEKEFNADISATGRSEGPKLMAQLTRKLSNVIAINNISLIVIQHLICNTSGYGAPYHEDGGNKIKYHMDNKLRIKSTRPWTIGSGDNEKTIGLILTWQIIVGALSVIPGTEAVSYIKFGRGIDHTMEYIDLGQKLGFINKAGAWFSYGDTKVQGEPKLYEFFENNPDQLKELKTKLCDMYGFEI